MKDEHRQPVLDIRNLRIERGDTVILGGVNWRVEAGQHWAMIGANGSGKTSLLSALTGYLEPTDGEIEVFGERFGETDWRELRQRIGLVSSAVRQMMAEAEPALESVISGRFAMIDYWGEITPADRKRGGQILRQIECEHLAARPWRVLSQGERQRVLIGRALMAEPRLLILDEPCAGLDPAAREHFLQFLERLGRRKDAPTLVLVTHHVEEIMPVFSHVLVLKAGQVLEAGEKNRVLTSRVLSDAFGAQTRVRSEGGRYTLNVAPRPRTVV
jgi:iron complex transport system ATP-binding protein